MSTRNRIILMSLLILTVSVVVFLVTIQPRDPLFRGKPEKEWIKNLAYNDSSQVNQWREFGPDGVRVLIRALKETYNNASKSNDMTHQTRMRLVDLLSSLGKDALEAAPVMAKALKDKTPGVRMNALSFFIDEEEDAFLHLPKETKRKLLPEFIRAIEDPLKPGLRNNAALALRYYPEQREIVTPVLVKALGDPVPKIRLLAAAALHRVAPDTLSEKGVVPVVIEVLKDPDGQVAYQAALLLGKIGKEPSLAVPALLKSVQGSNGLVASMAAHALGNFPDEVDVIVPVLLRVYQDTNSVVSRRASVDALKQLAPEALAKVKSN